MIILSSRRRFLKTLPLLSTALASPGVFAEALGLTPRQTEGPFFPDQLPLDTDNDLIRLNDALTPAVGEVTHLSGCVLDEQGTPIRNAVVEIWQVDNNGVYLHSGSPARESWDSNFQGFGRFLTGSTGEYYFRTIKPVPYAPGSFQRTPHIHFAIQAPGRPRFTTQCYINGHEMNERDGVLRGLADPEARKQVLVDFVPIPGTVTGEYSAHFDIILGNSPE